MEGRWRRAANALCDRVMPKLYLDWVEIKSRNSGPCEFARTVQEPLAPSLQCEPKRTQRVPRNQRLLLSSIGYAANMRVCAC